MNKEHCRQQAEAFIHYAQKFSDGDAVALFLDWCASKDLWGVERQEIWAIARRMLPQKSKVITHASDEFVRLSAVLEILFQNDLRRLEIELDKT